MTAAAGALGSARIARFTWQHPEWWTCVAAAGAGGAMLWHAKQHGAHVHHHLMPASQEAAHWLLMIVAMMLPLQFDQLRWVAFRSYARRRQPALLAYVLGYLGVWLVAGLPVLWLRSAPWTHTHWTAALAFTLAALWALTPHRERAALACHVRRGLVPSGWAGLLDTAKFGWQIGRRCAASCWPLMLACAVTGHDIIAMVGGSAMATSERLAFRPSPLRNMLGPLLLAAYYLWKAL